MMLTSNETLNGVASRQQMTNKEIKALKMQSQKFANFEVQQNRILSHRHKEVTGG